MDSSQSFNYDEQILFTELPELVWMLVIRNLGADFTALECCSEASSIFRSIAFKNGQVSLGIDKILPSVFREVIDGQEIGMDGSKSKHMRLLLNLVDLNRRITVFEIFVDKNFRPTDQLLNSFLKLQKNSLEILHICCVELRSDPVILDLTEMNRVRELKIMRSAVRNHKGGIRRAMILHFVPKHRILPALEKLSLSFTFDDCWNELSSFRGTRVKHVRFVDFMPAGHHVIRDEYRNAVNCAIESFPNLVSLEIPSMLQSISESLPGMNNLKRLTLTLPNPGNRYKYTFDMCISGYDKGLSNLIMFEINHGIALHCPCPYSRQLSEVADVITSAHTEENDYCTLSIVLDPIRGHLDTALTDFESLEELIIKSDSAEHGPTIVSYLTLINMKSLKRLVFSGYKPIHVPDKMMQKMRERYTVVCE